MVAKSASVSVRDLKAHVGALVARAARGERIVVTRYGTPRAVLAPPSGPTAVAPPRHASGAYRREERAFARLFARGRLEAHRGRYVAIHDGGVFDVDRDADALVRRAGRALGRKPFFVAFVGRDEPLVDLPGQELR